MGVQLTAKWLLLGLVVLMASYPARSQRPARLEPCNNPYPSTNLGLPSLNVIQSATLSPPYSCRSNSAFAMGYQGTALFLFEFSKQENSPELLFNGACGSTDYFDVNTAGDSMSLITDLGTTPLQAVTTQSAFNLINVVGHDTSFSWSANVVQGHTYAAVINQEYVRGLLVFTVVKFVPDQEVDLQFEVKDYQLNMGQIARSPGFTWSQ